jgi:predicted NBD/HSP70 family sugar kinase
VAPEQRTAIAPQGGRGSSPGGIAKPRVATHLHRLAVLETIRAQGPISRIDVARRTGLAPATVNRLAAGLVEAGLVVDVGEDARTGGRPSRLLGFNDAFGCLLAVDVADRHTDVAWVDLAGRIVREQRHVAPAATGEARRAGAIRAIDEALADPTSPPVLAIGMSVPGPVDEDGVVVFAPSLGWHGVPLRAQVAENTGLVTVVENDANLIALAEYVHGPWAGIRSLVAIAVFDGVGSGIVENGRVWRGADGTAGQLGRMLTEVRSLSRTYEGFGDLEMRLGRVGIVVRAHSEGLVADEDPSRLDEIVARVAAGDAGAGRFLDEILGEYAFSLVNVCAILAPEVIAFAGLFDDWADAVIPRLREQIHRQVIRMPRLERASSGGRGAVLGAARRAFEEYGSLEGLLSRVAAS